MWHRLFMLYTVNAVAVVMCRVSVPVQLGMGVPSGAEALRLAMRTNLDTQSLNTVMGTDAENANSVFALTVIIFREDVRNAAAAIALQRSRTTCESFAAWAS
jgi:hypothetical protein